MAHLCGGPFFVLRAVFYYRQAMADAGNNNRGAFYGGLDTPANSV